MTDTEQGTCNKCHGYFEDWELDFAGFCDKCGVTTRNLGHEPDYNRLCMHCNYHVSRQGLHNCIHPKAIDTIRSLIDGTVTIIESNCGLQRKLGSKCGPGGMLFERSGKDGHEIDCFCGD